MKLTLISISLQDKLILAEGWDVFDTLNSPGYPNADRPVVVGALTTGNKTVFLTKRYKSDETLIHIADILNNFHHIVKPDWNIIKTDQAFHLSLWDDNSEGFRAIGLIANDNNPTSCPKCEFQWSEKQEDKDGEFIPEHYCLSQGTDDIENDWVESAEEYAIDLHRWRQR